MLVDGAREHRGVALAAAVEVAEHVEGLHLGAGQRGAERGLVVPGLGGEGGEAGPGVAGGGGEGGGGEGALGRGEVAGGELAPLTGVAEERCGEVEVVDDLEGVGGGGGEGPTDRQVQGLGAGAGQGGAGGLLHALVEELVGAVDREHEAAVLGLAHRRGHGGERRGEQGGEQARGAAGADAGGGHHGLAGGGREVVDLTLKDSKGKVRSASVTLAADPDDETHAILGITTETKDLSFDLPVTIDMDSGDVTGPSAGLAWTLAVVDHLTEGDLNEGVQVAATGEIGPDGAVYPIGGLPQKSVAVYRSGIEHFLIPADSEDGEIAEAKRLTDGKVTFHKVSSVKEAMSVLDALTEK